MDSKEIKHNYKKYKKYSKILFREIKEKMEENKPDLIMLAKLNGELEKCIIIMRVYLNLLNDI
jgi:hypothetical protein